MKPERPTLDSRSRFAATAVPVPPDAAAAAVDAQCVVCPLSALECGQRGRVVGLVRHAPASRRLLALGVRPRVECLVLGRAAADGPLHLRAGTVHLMLRTGDADGVLVEVVGGPGVADAVPSL
jgi:Fe2+ transport system protein FeoA